MKNTRLTFLSIFLIAALVLSGLSTTLVQAQEEEEVELTGTITLIDEAGLFFEVEVEDEEGNIETYTIEVGEDFDFEGIAVGDEIELEGTPTDDEMVLDLTDYSIEEEDDDDEEDGEEDEGYFCDPETEDQHPVALAIAETYETDYESVIAMFCGKDTEGTDDTNRNGFGNIMLAFHTADVSGTSVEEVMNLREEGQGWGQIWQELLDDFGKPDDVGPPEGKGKPDDVGNGKPEDAGKPEDVGPPEGKGKPDHAGPRK